jgi:hypothetical protein
VHLVAGIDHCFHDEGPADCEERLSLASFSNSIHWSVCLCEREDGEKDLQKPTMNGTNTTPVLANLLKWKAAPGASYALRYFGARPMGWASRKMLAKRCQEESLRIGAFAAEDWWAIRCQYGGDCCGGKWFVRHGDRESNVRLLLLLWMPLLVMVLALVLVLGSW